MLSVRGSDELRAVVLALKGARRDVRNDIARATRSTMNPVWRDAVSSAARSDLDRRVIAQGARILAGNPPALTAATSRRRLPGGLVPTEQWQGVEFGSTHKESQTTYPRRTPGGRTTQVTRHTSRQLPGPAPKGRVAYAAVRKVAPRITSLWVQIIVRRFADALEGK